MLTVDEYRTCYARSNNEELRTLLDVQPERLTPEACQALAEEAARRGLARRNPRAALYTLASPSPLRLSYPKAPSTERFGAYIIDRIIAFGPVIVAGIFDSLFHFAKSDATRFINVFAMLAWAIYYTLTKDGHGNGQSVGKKLCRLLVIDVHTGEPCGLGQSIGRAIVAVLFGVIPLLGWLVEPIAVIGSDDGRRIGDRAAGTQVIPSSVYEASTRTSLGAASVTR